MPRRARPSRQRGQSLAELALILPILLLLVLGAIDFGRVYLGYVNAQQMARIAANYAANHATELAPVPDAAVLDEYRRLVGNDARLINCELPDPLPDPVFAEGTGLGAPVVATIPCRFRILAPVVGAILGGDVLVTASATFPVKQGAVTDVANGIPAVPPPVAAFLAAPVTGYAPLTVAFWDASENAPTSWVWDFGDGDSALDRDVVHTYDDPGTYTVRLRAANAGGSDTETRDALVEVTERPTTEPVAEFTADVQAGTKPLVVHFADASSGSPVSWLWAFGDGATSTAQNPAHTYAQAGAYDVTLTVTAADGAQGAQTKTAFVLVGQLPCVVPNFANTSSKDAQATWSGAGFTTSVQFLAHGKFTIRIQSLPGGMSNPPNGCDAIISVGP